MVISHSDILEIFPIFLLTYSHATTQAVKQHLIDNIFPLIIELKNMLAVRRSPLMKNVMLYLRVSVINQFYLFTYKLSRTGTLF